MSVYRKIHIVMALLLLAVVGKVQADCSDECEKSCCCEPNCCGKGFISADLLYLNACQGGLDDCFPVETTDYISSSGDVISRFRGRGEDPHFDWNAGFRLGTGYEFGCGWGIAAFWTHFHSHSNRHHRNDYESGYAFGNDHTNRWKLHFDVVDVIGGREFDLGSCFALTPFGGLRFARIEQKVHSDFFNSIDSNLGSSSDSFTTSGTRNRTRFCGVGPLIGVEADWNLGCNLSLYANASVAILYGHFHTHFNDSNDFYGGADYCEVKRHLCACQPVLDAGVGVRWHTCFCSSVVWFQLGLEHHSYFNQNRFGDYGDLCLAGVNFSAGFAY